MPTATWDDVGGLRPVKRALRELIELPLRRPELLAKFGMPAAKGALLYGPPGEALHGGRGGSPDCFLGSATLKCSIVRPAMTMLIMQDMPCRDGMFREEGRYTCSCWQGACEMRGPLL